MFLPLFVRVIANNPVFKTTCDDLDAFDKLRVEEQDRLQFER